MLRKKTRMHHFQVLFTVALVIVFTGCYRRDLVPPGSWPQLSTSEDIESLIAGSYSCSGDIVNSNTGLRPKSSLADFLTGGENPLSCERVELLIPAPGEILLRFMVGGREIARRNYGKNREYYVEKNWIFLTGFEEYDSKKHDEGPRSADAPLDPRP